MSALGDFLLKPIRLLTKYTGINQILMGVGIFPANGVNAVIQSKALRLGARAIDGLFKSKLSEKLAEKPISAHEIFLEKYQHGESKVDAVSLGKKREPKDTVLEVDKPTIVNYYQLYDKVVKSNAHRAKHKEHREKRIRKFPKPK